MRYQIQTMPIWDAFKSQKECPVCAIYAGASDRLVNQYLGEAVMEPDYRVRVNKRGFCDKHTTDLYAGDNKLGLGLQIHTRGEALAKSLKKPSSAKTAQVEADRIRKELSTCVICDQLKDTMERYGQTIAQMYKYEEDFSEYLEKCGGLCLPHYALLLEHCKYAGSDTEKYLTALYDLQKRQLGRINGELEWFTLKFDYRNADKPWRNSKDALPRAINKYRGELIN